MESSSALPLAPTPPNSESWNGSSFLIEPEYTDNEDEQFLSLIRANRAGIYSLLNAWTLSLETLSSENWELKLLNSEDTAKGALIAKKIGDALLVNKIVMAVVSMSQAESSDGFTMNCTVGACKMSVSGKPELYRDLLYKDVKGRQFSNTTKLGDFKIVWTKIPSSD